MRSSGFRRLRSFAVRLAPAPVRFQAGQRAESAKKFAAAERHYRAALARRPRRSEYALRLSGVLSRQGRDEEARQVARAAVRGTLHARYDAEAVISSHVPFFAERHEMAEFIVSHRAELRARIDRSLASVRPVDAPAKVFVFWDDPRRMPRLVRACRESLREHVGGGLELVELSDENLREWVPIEPRVREQMAKHPAHFSDYLRLQLLMRHGGLWLDSTCLLARPLEPELTGIRAEDFFLFQYRGHRTGSWFLWSRPDSYPLHAVAAVLELWWEREGRLTNYFMWHDIVEVLYWTDETYRAAWDAMPNRHPAPALELLAVLRQPFDRETWDRIVAGSFVHKITYKLPTSVFDSDTFAQRIATRSA